MIQQALNRDFVLSCMSEVGSYLAQIELQGGRRGEPTGLAELTSSDRQDVLEEIRAAQHTEAIVSSGQKGYDTMDARRGEAPPPIDEVSFFSRSAAVSNVQSAIEQYADEKKLVETVEPNNRRGGDPFKISTTDRRLLGQFEPADIKWISALAAMGIRAFRHKYPFRSRPSDEKPLKISNNARLVLVGDWGTGLPRAQQIANQISHVLTEGKKATLEQHVIHLGDVYYSGWKSEYLKRFLAYWPVESRDLDEIGSWTLNGNHDMYSGGHDYFGVSLEDARFKRWQRGVSYFALENDKWRIAGLDSAYDDFDLCEPQLDWFRRQVKTQRGQSLMLLTHHQPFSAYEPAKHKLQATVSKILAGNQITAWFWGHEHRCVLYKDYGAVKFGRCIGHGGVPVYMSHSPDAAVPDPGVYEYRGTLMQGIEPWARFGFAVLDFRDDSIDVRYIDETGEQYKEETISQ